MTIEEAAHALRERYSYQQVYAIGIAKMAQGGRLVLYTEHKFKPGDYPTEFEGFPVRVHRSPRPVIRGPKKGQSGI